MANQLSDDDVLLYLVVGFFVIGSGAVAAFWSQVTAWLLEHHLVVPAAHAIVRLPASAGVGLDARRLVAVVAITVAAAALGLGAVGRRGERS